MYIVGVDGGGTKTLAHLYTSELQILSEALAGPSNFQVIGVEKAAVEILAAVRECAAKAGIAVGEIGAVVAGLTGAGRAGDQDRMRLGLETESEKQKLGINLFAVDGDARTALEGAFSGKPGIIIIAGTGSIVFGKDRNETIHRAGGWGRLIGDEGSGYSIGSEAFRALAKMIDGRRKTTPMLALFAGAHKTGTQEEIIRALYKENFDIASVVPTVLKAAGKGDKAAKEILAKAACELLEVVAAAAEKVKKNGWKRGEKIPVSFVGSLLTNDNSYSKQMRAAIRRELPHLKVQEPEGSPCKGAALMGRKLLEEHA